MKTIQAFPWLDHVLFFFISLALTIGSAETIWAQSVGDYRSAASGNWNSVSTWETFNGSTWVPAVVPPTAFSGVITIRNGNIVTIATGVSFDQVVVDAGGQVTVASGILDTLANGTGTDLIVNGIWLNSGGTWTISSGATWSVGAGGTYIHNTTSGVATPLGSATLDVASNFIYRGSSTLTPAVSVSGRTYGNLSFESISGTWTASVTGSGTLTINGDFTIGSGVTYSTAQTGIMSFAGHFTNNGTLTNSTGTQIYRFTGVGKSISGASSIEFESWFIKSGAAISLARDVSVAATFAAIDSGALDCGVQIVAGAGNFSTIAGATLGIGSVDGISAAGATGNIQVTGTRTFHAGTNYTYNGSANQNVGNGFPNLFTGALTIENPGHTVTLDIPRENANGSPASLNLAAGTFATGTNLSFGTFGVGNVINRSEGTMTGSIQGGSFHVVNYTGGSKTAGVELTTGSISGVTVNLSPSNAMLTLGSNVLVSGTLTLLSGTVNLNGFSLDCRGDVVNNTAFTGAGRLKFGSSGGAHTVAGPGVFTNVEIDNFVVSLASSITVSDSLFLTTGTLAISSNTLTLNGALIRTSGGMGGGGSSTLSRLVVAGSGPNVTLPNMAVSVLKLDRASGISLGASVTVRDTLYLVNGNVSALSASLLANGAVVRTNGQVVGTFGKPVKMSSPSLTFEMGINPYTPLRFDFFGLTTDGGNLFVTAFAGEADDIGKSSIDTTKDVNAYWQFQSVTGLPSIPADSAHITLFYPQSLKDAGADASKFVVAKALLFDTLWTQFPVGARTDTSTEAITVTDLTAFTIQRFIVGQPKGTTVTASINSGWNLVSVPVTPASYSASTLFPDAVSGTIYGFLSGAYTSESTLVNGEGYWAFYGAAGSNNISGDAITTTSVTVSAGNRWVLIGSLTTSQHVGKLTSNPPGAIVPGTLFGYNGTSYFTPTMFEPGKGYWLFVNAACILTIAE